MPCYTEGTVDCKIFRKRGFVMKGLSHFAQVLSKILEIAHWAAAAVMLVLLAVSFLSGEWLSAMIVQENSRDVSLSTYGFELVVLDPSGAPDLPAIRIFTLGAVPIFCLMALVFRDIYLILKTARGEAQSPAGPTPFQPVVVRRVREIGIFYLAIFAVSLLFSTIAALVLGPEACESSIDLGHVMVGILILCLSQAFQEGARLREDVEGLV